MTDTDLNTLRAQTDPLIANLTETVQQVKGHDHPKYEDIHCLNLVAYMGERMATVLRRLAAEQAEVDWLREQIYAQKPVIDAVNTWAEAHEDGDHEATIRATADLYGAVEEYRLMDHALTTARNEQPEHAR